MTDQQPAQEQSPAPPQNTGSGEQGSVSRAGESPAASVTPAEAGDAVSNQNPQPSEGQQPFQSTGTPSVEEVIHLRRRAQQAEHERDAFRQQAGQYEQALQGMTPLLTEAQHKIQEMEGKAGLAEIESRKAEIALKQLREKSQEFGFTVDDGEIRAAEARHADAQREARMLQQQADLLNRARKEWREELLQSQQAFQQQQQIMTAQQAFSSELESSLNAAQVSPQVREHLKEMAVSTWEAGQRQRSATEILGPILSNFRVQQAATQAAQQAAVQQHPPTQQGPSGTTQQGQSAPQITIHDAPPEIRNSGDAVKMMQWLKSARANAGQG